MAEINNPQLPSDWHFSDRESFSARWNRANVLNLMRPASGFKEYQTITERAAFYNWFDQIREVQLHATFWPAAAMLVASQMQNLENPFKTAAMTARRTAIGPIQTAMNIVSSAAGSPVRWGGQVLSLKTSEGIVNFGKLGNKAIFDDVFPRLSDLFKRGLLGSPLTGDEARRWDEETLRHEQFDVVQPIYLKAALADPSIAIELKDLAEGSDVFSLSGIAIGGRLDFTGDIMSAHDRFNHGMNVVIPFYKRFKRAIDGGRKRRQTSRPDPTAGGMISVKR